jgi:hypothetical protein
MFNFNDKLEMSGHLQIFKQYRDGREELYHDDHNIIVSGMGVGLSLLFQGAGSNLITDYQITYFQLGTSGTSALEVSSTYQLSSPLTAAQYGTNAALVVATIDQIKNGVIVQNLPFLVIPFNQVTRVTDSSVRYTLSIDENSSNGIALNEIGIFIKNPLSRVVPAAILAAYKSFPTITKSNSFNLVFRWTLQF